MTLDEAIKHCEENAIRQREYAEDYKSGQRDYLEKGETTESVIAECIKCAEEHEQLAEWLKELKAYKEKLQGEWLFVSRNCWKCPYCQELTNEGKNFCPNCGADMRKGGAV